MSGNVFNVLTFYRESGSSSLPHRLLIVPTKYITCFKKLLRNPEAATISASIHSILFIYGGLTKVEVSVPGEGSEGPV